MAEVAPRRLRAAIAAAATAIALLAIGASPASASTWFAAPGGDGPDPCTQSDPCDIYDAVEDAPADTRIAALTGTYDLGAVLHVHSGIVLQGPYSGPPAVLQGDGTTGAAVSATGAGTRVTDFAIRQSSIGDGVAIGGGAIGDRLDSSTSGPGAACAPTYGGVVRDSLCRAAGAGGNGVDIDEVAPGAGSIELTNVTAVSAGDGGGAAAVRISAQTGADVEVDGVNLIAAALGDAPDIAIGALSASAEFDLVHSNYDSVADLGGGTSVTPTDTNSNQSAEPGFTNPAGGDFTEAPGSPTIDAGGSDVTPLGLLDIVRHARVGSGTPDIGAYEFVPPPDSRAPNVSIPVAPKGRIKTTKRFVDLTFELVSDESDVTFECKINRMPAQTCTSPVTFRLEATKGIGTTYTLVVRATDAAGNRSGKAIRQVQLIRKKKG